MQENVNRESYDAVVYLMACALNDLKPDVQYLESRDISTVLTLASKHSVLALVTYALEKVGLAPAKAIERKNMAMRRALMYDVERAEILKAFEKEKIKYLPLKGIYTKELYPALGLREMSDNDILFDPEFRERVRDIMVARGYTVDEDYGRFNHDVYMKAPVFNFEMHVSLFGLNESRRFVKYYENIWEKLSCIDGTEYGYKMSDDDFYIHLKLHEYKHYSHGGIGIRSLADTYLFIREKGEGLDFDYVDRELSGLGVAEHEKNIRTLAMKIFSRDFAMNPCQSIAKMLDGELYKIYEYMCFSGTYGSSAQNISNAIAEYEKSCGSLKRAKLVYLWRRLFPPMEVYEIYYPFYYKHKILLPYLFFVRLFRAVFKKPGKMLKTVAQVAKTDKKGN